jgi:hypothetical protein
MFCSPSTNKYDKEEKYENNGNSVYKFTKKNNTNKKNKNDDHNFDKYSVNNISIRCVYVYVYIYAYMHVVIHVHKYNKC